MKQFFENNGYTLEKYTKGSNSIQITRHLECGNLYPVRFSDFKYHNSRCPICSGNAPISENEMKQFFENNGYTLEKYTKGSNSIQITRHLECGNLYPVRFSDFKYHNRRCSYCSSGRTEKLC